ncbi:unnamed protein product [Closterium sp. Naga37s-1]|nr:unnamed protein product [Closterium sp. Naga37s-1]
MKPTMTRRLAAGYLIVAILASLVLQGLAARRDLQEIPGVRTYKVTVGGVLPYHIRPWHRGVQWDWTPPKLYPQYVLLFRWVQRGWPRGEGRTGKNRGKGLRLPAAAAAGTGKAVPLLPFLLLQPLNIPQVNDLVILIVGS